MTMERAHTLLCKMIHHNIGCAWHAWVEAVWQHDKKQRAAKLVRRVVGRVLHQQLWGGFDTWKTEVQEAVREEKAAAERAFAAQEIIEHQHDMHQMAAKLAHMV